MVSADPAGSEQGTLRGTAQIQGRRTEPFSAQRIREGGESLYILVQTRHRLAKEFPAIEAKAAKRSGRTVRIAMRRDKVVLR